MDDCPPFSPFSAAVLAGGRSLRMGHDKASIVWKGRRLLDQQIAALGSLGPEELLVSGRQGIDYAIQGIRVVVDEEPDLGPLAGLVAVLKATTAPHVLVLAVDLPAMTPEFLKLLLSMRRPGVGIVPRISAGWEPLVSVYPREIMSLAKKALERRHLSLQQLVSSGVASGMLEPMEPGPERFPLFRNLNSQSDLEHFASEVPS